jgi:hypothetical protein
MAAKASMTQFKKLQKRLETAQNRAKKIREVADDKVAVLIKTTEVSGAAFAAGVLRGAFPKSANMVGIPNELAIAAAFHGVALFGGKGSSTQHLHNFGDGFLAAFAVNLGQSVGVKGFKGYFKELLPGGEKSEGVSGALPYYDDMEGQRLSAEELEELYEE